VGNIERRLTLQTRHQRDSVAAGPDGTHAHSGRGSINRRSIHVEIQTSERHCVATEWKNFEVGRATEDVTSVADGIKEPGAWLVKGEHATPSRVRKINHRAKRLAWTPSLALDMSFTFKGRPAPGN
jgi:hypothetical protein